MSNMRLASLWQQNKLFYYGTTGLNDNVNHKDKDGCDIYGNPVDNSVAMILWVKCLS